VAADAGPRYADDLPVGSTPGVVTASPTGGRGFKGVPRGDRRLEVRDEADHLIAVVTRTNIILTLGQDPTPAARSTGRVYAPCPKCPIGRSDHSLDPRKMRLALREDPRRPLKVGVSQVTW
jgi:hypothetical protein